jgi:diguanylate cyclase (GGDEF)-like protein/PAS domain S-box-containing protein
MTVPREGGGGLGGTAERSQAELQAIALDAVEHGLCVFDRDLVICLSNRRMRDLFDMPEQVVRPGSTMLDLLRYSAAMDRLDGVTLDEAWRARLALIAQGRPFVRYERFRDGRTVSISYRPAGDGGWIATHQDVTDQHRLEGELRAQAGRFGQALDNMSHGLAMFGEDERLIVCNAQYLRLFGYDPAIIRPGIALIDVLAHALERGFYSGQTLEKLIDDARAWRKTGMEQTGVVELTGSRRLSIRRRPMPGGGWVFTCEDITEREKAAEALGEQHRRFGQALANMSHGLSMFDADERLIICNRQYVDLFGFDPGIVRPGAALADILAHAIELGHYPGMSHAEVMVAARERVQRGGDFGVRVLPDGRLMAARSSPMPDGGWVFTCEDITGSERAAAELREQHKRFDTALNAMSQGLCMFDESNRLIVCNEVYVSIFNSDPAVARPGVTMMEMFEHGVACGNYPGFSAQELYDRRMSILARGGVQTYDQPMADGRTIACTLRTMDGGGWLGMFEDVTEERQAAAVQAETMVRLHHQNLVMDATLDNMAQGLCVYDKDFNVLVRNRRYLEIYGLGEHDALPGTPLIELVRNSVREGIHDPGWDADAVYNEFISRLIENKDPVLHRKLADGRIIEIRTQPMANGGWVATFEDITAQERAAEALREQHRRFDAALNNMAHGLAMLDKDLNLIVCNRRYLDMYGLSPEVVRPGSTMRAIVEHSVALGNYRDITPDEIITGYFDRLSAGQYLSHRQLADGRIFKVLYEPMEHGGWVAIHEDVTERRKAEQHIAHMAHHDALTDLPNRVLFRERMAEGLLKTEATGEPLALLCLDLDHFKAVNDTLGHPIGDQLLTAVAERLAKVVGRTGMLARLGGDEFAILLHAATAQAAETLARRLVRTMTEPFVIEGHLINTGLSVGIAVAPGDGTAGDHLMKCADLALYRAKSEGRGMFRFFEPDMGRRLQARRELELDLRQALSAGEFSLSYQPQVRAATQELAGFEALIRWNQIARGPVSPADFIPLAEETGLILPIGEWVLREACREAARWPAPLKVAVNLSPVQFKNRRLVRFVKETLEATGLAPSRLELEITEAVLLQNDDVTIAMLHELRALGIRIAMDDFGVGYSSLSYLRSFPFDKIKIDRSFIADLDRNRDNAAIVRAMAGLGASLNVDTTAEGVETAEQLAVVRQCGCTEIQGYLISAPRPAAQIGALIAELRGETGDRPAEVVAA